MKDVTERVRSRLLESIENFRVLTEQASLIAEVGQQVAARMKIGGMTMFCGNGGSAADAQHLAAELQGRFLHDRAPLAAIALSVNSSTLTAIGNDYGFDQVFERQIAGLARTGDIVIGLSTSGNSANVIRAMEVARRIGALTVALTGETGGQLGSVCEMCVRVPSTHTARVQEMHIAVGHMICEIVEEELM